MENGSWRFGEEGEGDEVDLTCVVTIRKMLEIISENLNKEDQRPIIHLGHGDPSSYPSFRTSPYAEDAFVHALRSAHFNGYSPAVGLPPARSAVAEYLSRDLPYELSTDDVYLTVGAHHAIEVVLNILSRRLGTNILLPSPGYSFYEVCAKSIGLEVRHFDLLPEKGWEVDLDNIEAIADDKTAAMVIINPGNPCGNVYSYEHLKKVAEMARRLGIMVIADEVYYKLVFGNKPFVAMGVFGSTVPVISISSVSKRWMVPGWRLGWIATNDPNGVLLKHGIVKGLKDYFNTTANPATIAQGAIAQIIENTPDNFFEKTISTLREVAEICYGGLQEIPCMTCSYKPEGAMSLMVKLNVSMLEDIADDVDFCVKLAKEESVLLLPGMVVGLKNWLRVTFAAEPHLLKDGLARLKSFCSRHAKNNRQSNGFVSA